MADIADLAIRVDTRDVKGATKDLDKLDGTVTGATKSAELMGKAMGVAVAAFASGAMGSWIDSTTRGIAEMDKFARVAGTTSDEFQRVAYGATRFGIEQDKLSDILKDVNDKVGDFLSTGAGPMADFFEQIAPRVGITADEFKGLSGPQALGLYINSLEKANVNQQEMTFYLEALANDATLLQPLFEDNGRALAAYSAEAERLGLVLSSETIQQSKEFQNSLATLGALTSNVSQQIAAQMLPTLNDLTGTIIDMSAETQVMTAVADTLGAALKSLATVAIGIRAAFQTTGEAIGAVAASMVMAADGEFQQAWDTLNAGTADYLQTAEETLNRVKDLWTGTAGETAARATVVRDALTNVAGAGRIATAETTKLTDAQKAAAKAAADLARDQQANADVIAELTEQLFQASLGAEALAMRQNELKLNEYATPEQLAQVRALTAELSKLEAAKKAETELAPVMRDISAGSGSSEIDALILEQEEKRRVIDEARAAEVLSATAHAEAMVLLDQQTAARRKEILDAQTAAQQASALAAADSIISVTTAQVSQLQTLFMEGSAIGQAFFVATQALAAANAVIQGIQAAMAIRVAYATMAAMSGPAAPAVLAAGEVHANLAMGMGYASAGMIAAQTVASFEGGGWTGSGPRSGGLDGKGGELVMVHPQEEVIDHYKGGASTRGRSISTTNNFILQGRPDNRTQTQIAQRASQTQRRAQVRFGK